MANLGKAFKEKEGEIRKATAKYESKFHRSGKTITQFKLLKRAKMNGGGLKPRAKIVVRAKVNGHGLKSRALKL